MGVCYRSSYPSLSLNRPPLGAEPLVKEQTPSAAGAGLMMLWCHMSNLITCWVDWHFRWWLLATALQAHLTCKEGAAKWQQIITIYSEPPTSLYTCDKMSTFSSVTEMSFGIEGHKALWEYMVVHKSFLKVCWHVLLSLTKTMWLFECVCMCAGWVQLLSHVVSRQLLIIASTAAVSLISP